MSQPAPNLSLETGSQGRPGPLPLGLSTCRSSIDCVVAGRSVLQSPGDGDSMQRPRCATRARGNFTALSLTGGLCLDLLLEPVPVKIKGHLRHQGTHFQARQEPGWSLGRHQKIKPKTGLRDHQEGTRGQQTPRRPDVCPRGPLQIVDSWGGTPLVCCFSSAPAECPMCSTCSLKSGQCLEFPLSVQYHFAEYPQGQVINAHGNMEITK